MDLIQAFADINNSDRLLQDLRDAVVQKALFQKAEDFYTFIPGIKGGQQVVALRDYEYVTKQQDGCEPTFTDFSIEGISQKWNPRSQDVRIKLCYKDFEGAFIQWGLANGYDRRNLQEADFFDFIIDMTSGAMSRDLVRIATHGNKDIAVDDILGGNAIGDLEDYDTIDAGLLKTLHIFKAMPKLAGQFIDISKNEAATKAEQLALNEGAGYKIYDDLNESLEFEGGDQFLTSHTLYKNYKDMFRGKTLESAINAIQKSFEPQFDNKTLKPMKWAYDQVIKRDFEKEGVLYQPHFAMIADKRNLQIGVDDVAALTDLRLEYPGGKDENFYIKASYLMDFKIPNPYAVQAAF